MFFLNLGNLPISVSTPTPPSYISSNRQHHLTNAMSPDSSNWTASSSPSCSSGVSSGCESTAESLDGQNELDALPDSTTGVLRSHQLENDAIVSTTNALGVTVDNIEQLNSAGVIDDDQLSINSDPINSSGSEYSFAASPPMFHDQPHNQQEQSNNILDDLLLSEPNNNLGGIINNKRPAPTSNDTTSVPAKRKKKSKVGPTDLKCAQCEYTTRVKEHLTSHMNCHVTERKYR
jgi:hypothetical protein